MADIVNPATRSRMMSRIRGTNTKPELAVRRYLHRAGLRYRLHARLPGRPDIVLPRFHAVVQVHGCFWHRHPQCRFSYTPASNSGFWQRKFRENVKRDQRVESELTSLGWRVFTVWECEAGNPRTLAALLRRIRGRSR